MPVTHQDITDLRSDLSGLKDSIDEAATKSEVKRGRTKDRRMLLLTIFVVGVAVAVLVFNNWWQNRQQEEATRERRVAFCHSLDEIESAINAGNVAGIRTILDPKFTSKNADPALVQQFIDTYGANAKDGVQSAIMVVKAANGFSPDCQLIPIPKEVSSS